MKPSLAFLLTLVVCLAAATAWSQPPATDTRLADEISSLTKALEKLSSQLEQDKQQHDDDVRLRKLDLAIAYLNFRSRRIEALERDIDSHRALRARLEDNLPIISQRLSDLELRMQDYPQGPPPELKEGHDELRSQLEMLRERMSRVDDELVMKENQLYELQNQIRDVEEYVQKHLEM